MHGTYSYMGHLSTAWCMMAVVMHTLTNRWWWFRGTDSALLSLPLSLSLLSFRAFTMCC